MVESFEILEKDKKFIVEYKTRREAESASIRGRNVAQLPVMKISFYDEMKQDVMVEVNPE